MDAYDLYQKAVKSKVGKALGVLPFSSMMEIEELPDGIIYVKPPTQKRSGFALSLSNDGKVIGRSILPSMEFESKLMKSAKEKWCAMFEALPNYDEEKEYDDEHE
jgi:hypothetical protein